MNTLPDNNLFNGGVLVSAFAFFGFEILELTPYVELYGAMIGAAVGTWALCAYIKNHRKSKRNK
jgi:hypothetical protein